MNPSPAGLTIDPAWLLATVTTVVSVLAGAVATIYRGRITDLQNVITRQDEMIDRLLTQIGRAADATEKSVTLAARERAQRRSGQ